MFKHKRSQSGFGIVEALCFIVMFSMVGLIGWYVINENQNSQETLDNIGGAEVQTSSAKPSTAGDKFVFKELGVQIILSDGLEDLSYEVSKEHVNLYNVTTVDFKNSDKLCSGFFGQIFRNDGEYNPNSEGGNSTMLLKQFQESHVAANFPFCTGDYPEAQILISELKKAFQSATDVR